MGGDLLIAGANYIVRTSLAAEGSKMLQQAKMQAKSSTTLKGNHRRLLSQGVTRSSPASPSLTASRSPSHLTSLSVSAPPEDDAKRQKLQAIRVPLVHLLATRPLSARYLSQKINCTEADCKEILKKVGQRGLDDSKFDLAKQAYKELDVWSFDYSSQDDRELAIGKAISAFDRQRIGKDDHLWQMLLPRAQRGKGKCLSKLNLQAGQAKKAMTPKINVQDTDRPPTASKASTLEGDKSHRLAPSDAEPMARAQSQSQHKKSSVKDKEAQGKKVAEVAAKKPIALSKVTKANNISNTAKKTVTKPGIPQGKIKSAEFVHESDDDSDDQVSAPKKSTPKAVSRPTPTHSSTTASKPKAPAQKEDRPKFEREESAVAKKGIAMKKLPSTGSSTESKSNKSDSSQEAVPMAKSQSRQRTTSSPHKPSPLGSSPPANASDMDVDVQSPPPSSRSSTPLIAQAQKTKIPNGIKQNPGHLRTPSDSPLKRKANELDSGIHDHSGMTANDRNTTKRPKTSPMSPPTSDSSTGGRKVAPLNSAKRSTVDMAKQFKRIYEKYYKTDRELRAMERPPPDRVVELVKMRNKLIQMKTEIGHGVTSL